MGGSEHEESSFYLYKQTYYNEQSKMQRMMSSNPHVAEAAKYNKPCEMAGWS